MRVIIVGGGIAGLATAWALQKSDVQVTLLEQGPLPNPLASSVDDHRLIRYPYGTRLGFTRMVGEAYAAWDEMWADLGERHYVETGTLVLGGPSDPYNKATVETLEAAGLGEAVAWLTEADLARDYPLLEEAAIATGGFRLNSGGALRCGRIVQALARHLAFIGVDLRPHSQVVDVDPVLAQVTLSDGTRLGADAIIVTAGAWVTKLLPALAATVTPSRQVIVYVAPPPDTVAVWQRMPMLLNIGENNAGFYLVPPIPGTGLKIGDHRFSRAGDPDAPRTATLDDARAVLEQCRGQIRNLDAYRILEPKACFYTVEPRESFVFHQQDKLLAVSACSGHGFKFGSIIGKTAASLVQGQRSLAEVTRWATGD
ncbi:MAG: NAD(P)/FAD-dependent oxidoreductase [Elstera sp.]